MITSTGETAHKWGWGIWVWPPAIGREVFPVSPCQRQRYFTLTVILSQSVAHQLSADMHMRCIRTHLLAGTCTNAHIYSRPITCIHIRGDGAERVITTGALAEALKVKTRAFRIQKWWSNWCQSYRIAGSSSRFWCLNLKVWSRAEINTTVCYRHLTHGVSYHSPDKLRKLWLLLSSIFCLTPIMAHLIQLWMYTYQVQTVCAI